MTTPMPAPSASRSGAAPVEVGLPGRLSRHVLENGLRVRILHRPESEIVATSLWYGAGTRHERPGELGWAHFLEHVMFRGTAAVGPGELDRRTQALGGSNEAFTSHDAACYGFQFGAEVWTEALELEADRMHNLCFDAEIVDTERRVILEELSMVESEPWEQLEQAVAERVHGDHAYARPILGTRESLQAVTAEGLEAFYRRLYRPANAVLGVSGAASEEEVLQAAARAFGSEVRLAGRGPVAGPRPVAPLFRREGGPMRVHVPQGETRRLLMALPAPPTTGPRHPLLLLLLAAVAGGRSTRFHRTLVEERSLCGFVELDASSSVGPNVVMLAAEAMPDVEAAEVEWAVLEELSRLVTDPPSPEEIAVAHRLRRSEWLFEQETVARQAQTVACASALFEDGHFERCLTGQLAADAEAVTDFVRDWLPGGALPAGSVIGWAGPEEPEGAPGEGRA